MRLGHRALALVAVVEAVLPACHLVLPYTHSSDGGPADVAAQEGRTLDAVSGDLPDGAVVCPGVCALGCLPGTATCRRFTPSNLGGAAPPPSCGKVVLGAETISTTDCKVLACQGATLPSGIPAPGPAKLCVMVVDGLTVSGVTRVAGLYPWIVLADGPVEIETGALLDASAVLDTAGPGGFAGGTPLSATEPANGEGPGAGVHCGCATGDGLHDDCGGGGAGYGAAGAQGGLEEGGCGAPGYAGGKTYGDNGLVPLLGGSGGASGHNENLSVTLGAGGAGGGAVQISSQATIRIDGAISAGGGGGGAGITASDSAAGGGGGSGGAILLEAAQLLGAGWLAVNGGGGGGGGENGNGTPGEDGQPDGSAAKGGPPGPIGGAGGDGGSKGLPGKPGGDVVASLGGGGGGGGGGGRIHANLPGGSSLPSTLQLSGVVTQGALGFD